MKQKTLVSSVTAALLAVSPFVLADDMSDMKAQIEQLQKRINTLESTGSSGAIITAPKPKYGLTLKGHVNRAVMYADDGVDSDTFFVDNDNSSSRLNIDGKAAVSDDVTVGVAWELEYQSNASNTVVMNQTASNSSETFFKERKIELYFDSKTLGRLWLGQGDMASNTTTEQDLSGTSIAGYSLLNGLGGALSFRDSDAVNNPNVATITQVTTNFDGLSRDDRVRYDTPSLGGLMLSASATTGGAWDAAAYLARSFGPVKVAAAGFYADPQDLKTYESRYGGSASFLYEPIGISLTLAYGQESYDLSKSTRDDEATSYYGKLGYQFKGSDVGKTAIALSYGITEDYNKVDDELSSWGLGLVQNIDKAATEVFFQYQGFSLDRTGTNVEDIFAIMGGARVKF
ncbi:hypothetical protein BegalDRAFT_2211 [Beggiatoa alba B18LD]|uniref:Porin domain-containing protein n=1 Tax=Beggiatoa alba B18LD TaxID=395493 RepID=I3CHH4_9GAMM|nr:porin [Beggiatoa alba]EIJ43067.1 hypothetical protein BegalDRAFT_2211 [Beggiatoa alba B18LD]